MTKREWYLLALAALAFFVLVGAVSDRDGNGNLFRWKTTSGSDGHVQHVNVDSAISATFDTGDDDDYDTGGGTDTVKTIGIALPASGGAVAGGTTTNPVVVRETDGTNLVEVLATGADDLANTLNQKFAAAFGYVYDGTTWDRLRGDSTNGAFVNVKVMPVPTTGYYGQVTVATSGTEQALGASQALTNGCMITCLSANTGSCWVGYDSSVTTSNGDEIPKGQKGWYPVANRATLYVDVSTNGDKVSYTCT